MSHLLSHGGHYLAVVAVCLLAFWPLANHRWVWRMPRAGILLWQLLGFSLGLSLVGLCLAVGLAPYRTGELRALARLAGAVATGGTPPPGFTAGHVLAIISGLALAAALAAAMGRQLVAVARARRRHRSLLSLVADPDPAEPGLLLIDHPAAVAYCLPGRRRTVVVSAGAVGRLDRDQLAAVLAHERGHAAERHDLILLPFAALRRALPGSRLAARAHAEVSLLVEMRADDLALRRHPRQSLASALRVIGGSGDPPAPEGALAAAGGQVGPRLARMTRPAPAPRGVDRLAAGALLAIAVAIASTPISLYFLP